MGDVKRRRAAVVPKQKQMLVTDLDDAGAVLAEYSIFCEQCGEKFPLWPPDLLRFHNHKEHAETLWPAIAQAWETYTADNDLARRANFLNNYRVSFLFQTLATRRDLYERLIAAGMIVEPKQG